MFEYKLNGELIQTHIVVSSENRMIANEVSTYFESNIEHDTTYKASRIIINTTSESDFYKHPEIMKVYF